MSWLAANWFGVCVIFSAPAVVGVLGWIVTAYAGGDSDHRARERARRETRSTRERRAPGHRLSRPRSTAEGQEASLAQDGAGRFGDRSDHLGAGLLDLGIGEASFLRLEYHLDPQGFPPRLDLLALIEVEQRHAHDQIPH